MRKLSAAARRKAMARLPAAAAAKIREIEKAREAADIALADAVLRLEEHRTRWRPNLHLELSEAQFAEFSETSHALDAAHKSAQRRATIAAANVATVVDFLDWLNETPDAFLVSAPQTITDEDVMAGNVVGSLDRLRQQIQHLHAELADVQRAGLPEASLNETIEDFVGELSRYGSPKISIANGKFSYEPRLGRNASEPATLFDVAAMIAWYCRTRVTDALQHFSTTLPAHQRPRLTMDERAREARALYLGKRIEQLERREEALLQLALAKGADVLRRHDAPGYAILALAFGERPIVASQNEEAA